MPIRIPEHVQKLVAYKPGRPIKEVMEEYKLHEVIKLASNENPLGASPKALKALQSSLSGLEFYPNGGKTIRQAIAKELGITLEEVIAGSGSEGVMNTILRSFLIPGDRVVTSAGTFGGFYVLAHACGLDLVTTRLKDYAYDLDAIADTIDSKTRLVYLANPNNPTGSVFTKSEFERFYKRVPNDVLILHDEAYYDFAIDDIEGYYTLASDIRPNVITLRTFSKSHGLAAVRIGYGTGPAELVSMMLKVKLPFEPSEQAQAAGIGAIGDASFLNATVRMNREGRKFYESAFRSLKIPFTPTAANFFCIHFDTGERAGRFAHEMESRGVIVRHLAGFGMPEAVRISIGRADQNARAVAVMRELRSKEII